MKDQPSWSIFEFRHFLFYFLHILFYLEADPSREKELVVLIKNTELIQKNSMSFCICLSRRLYVYFYILMNIKRTFSREKEKVMLDLNVKSSITWYH